MVDNVVEFRKAQRASGPATVMAIGTAIPVNCVDQFSYPDYYFRVTNSDHMTELKNKFKRMCEKTKINTRYLHLTEDILKENPNMCIPKAPSWDARRDILVEEIPKLGEKAAKMAITEWGQPLSKITHLIFCNTGGVDMPGPDFRLAKLLGLNLSVKRYLMYQQGCYGGGTVLRLAKDLVENNKGARVLVVCCEISSVAILTSPDETRLDNLLGQAIFGDGAGAAIVGADPIIGVEKPLFQILSALQTIIPNSFPDIDGRVSEEGFIFHISKYVTEIVSSNLETCLKEAFQPLSHISDWNSLFWILHPGGRAIVDRVEEKLNLEPEKLHATRHVLEKYGNMLGASVIFVLDEMRKKSVELGFKTTGEGLKSGVLLGLGPGITVETVILNSMPI